MPWRPVIDWVIQSGGMPALKPPMSQSQRAHPPPGERLVGVSAPVHAWVVGHDAPV
jgi:hypothetical protein